MAESRVHCSVTNEDIGGPGLTDLFPRLSGGAPDEGMTQYACASEPNVTVGASANCREPGLNTCEVDFYDTDTAGKPPDLITAILH